MRYGIRPEGMAERLALLAGKVPVPVIDVLYGPLQARAIMAAARFGVFEALARGPAEAGALAAALSLDAGCLESLLRMLVHSGYLRLSRGRFSLSRIGRRSVEQYRGYIEWNYTQWEILARMEEALRSGRGVDLHATMCDAAGWEAYQRGQAEIAREPAEYLAAKVPVRAGARSLIDLGGSHGLMGAAICRKHPPLRSTVLDLEAAIPAARRIAKEAGVAGIVNFRACDVLRDDLGSNHDVAVLANVLHHFDAEQNAALLARVRAALSADGAIAILEFETPGHGRPAVTDALALYFRLTSNAQVYSREEISGWLKAAGFCRLRVHRPKLFPGYVLLTARPRGGA